MDKFIYFIEKHKIEEQDEELIRTIRIKQEALTLEELELLKNHLKWNDTNKILEKKFGTLEQRCEILKKLEGLNG